MGCAPCRAGSDGLHCFIGSVGFWHPETPVGSLCRGCTLAGCLVWCTCTLLCAMTPAVCAAFAASAAQVSLSIFPSLVALQQYHCFSLATSPSFLPSSPCGFYFKNVQIMLLSAQHLQLQHVGAQASLGHFCLFIKMAAGGLICVVIVDSYVYVAATVSPMTFCLYLLSFVSFKTRRRSLAAHSGDSKNAW